ncbi:hypothetical protein LM594_02725 [Candidatus Caldipriscus sp.]|nr:hypothetical protein [Candidatus Caldipriscus sp.]
MNWLGASLNAWDSRDLRVNMGNIPELYALSSIVRFPAPGDFRVHIAWRKVQGATGGGDAWHATPNVVFTEVKAFQTGAVFYDVLGRRVEKPNKGIFFKVSGGKVEKVILR